MPLKMGHSSEVVGSNIREMMKAGHPKAQAIAAALSMKRKSKKMADGGQVSDEEKEKTYNPQAGDPSYSGLENNASNDKKSQVAMGMGKAFGMADGGMVGSSEEFDDNENPMTPYKKRGAARTPADMESMSEMGDHGDDDTTSLNQNRMNSYSRVMENEVDNPEEIDEASMFANALKKQKNKMMSPENPEGDWDNYAMGGLVQPDHDPDMGNKPSENMSENADEDMEAGNRPSDQGLEHRMMMDPSGPGLSMDAKEALMRKKKGRRYGSVT